MSTSKLDAIRELLKTQEEKHVIQAVWSAYNLTEAEAVRMVKQAQGIDTTVKGYPDPFILATEHICVEQDRAENDTTNGLEPERNSVEIPVSCPPALKANNHKNHLYGYLDKRKKEHEYPFPEVLNDGGFGMLHWATELIYYGPAIGKNIVPESWMYQPFVELSNDKTDRA